MTSYCTQCSLRQGDPLVQVDDDGICSDCRRDPGDEWSRQRSEAFDRFLATTSKAGEYDVLVMLSGGKDSVYALREMLRHNKRVLAFTFMHHAEEDSSSHRNLLEKVLPRGGFEHVSFMANDRWSRLMRYALMSKVEPDAVRSLEKKRALNLSSHVHLDIDICNVCGAMCLAEAIKTAYRHGIPYVVTGEAPKQIARRANVYSTLLEQVEIERELRGEEYHDIVWGDFPERASRDALPELFSVFEQGGSKYSEQEIIETLTQEGWLQEGMYAGAHASCSMYILYWYHAMKHYKVSSYIRTNAEQVRLGQRSRQETLVGREALERLLAPFIGIPIEQWDVEGIARMLASKGGAFAEAAGNITEVIQEARRLAKRIDLPAQFWTAG